MNFWTNPEFCSDFDGDLDVDTIISNISLHFPNLDFKSNNILIFLDEIQDCPKACLSSKNDAIAYLRQAHIVSIVYNVEAPSLPLVGEKIESQFKLFPEDIGIVSSMYGIDTIAAINKVNLGQGKGVIYEALVFDSLNKAGIEPFYFSKESGLEIDFVISYNGYATLIEAKVKIGNTKSSKTVMKHPEHYGKTKLIKIGDYNISEEGDIITIPHYLTFVLGKIKYDF